jgi:cation diffusion facilitator CzcD-associated flavoprotein CzcO
MIQKYREEQRVQRVKIAIVGSGFAGIGMGIKLIDNGEGDFVILERSNQPGGTWRDNTYPGAACDVPSHLYSF